MINLEEFAHISLLGQSKNFSMQEIEEILDIDEIRLDTMFGEKTELLVTGRVLNPLLEEIIDTQSKKASIKVIPLTEFEEALSSMIHLEGLAISLKLSNDNERVLSYLKNSLLSDATYIEILKLFDWQSESFFDNDANRDVSASITKRFYKNLEKNHNVEYSPMGILQTVSQTKNSDLLDVIFTLPQIRTSFNGVQKSVENQILQSIALNENISDSVIETIIDKEDIQLIILLSTNQVLSTKHKQNLIEFHPKHLNHFISYIGLEASFFDQLLVEKFVENLARNESLTDAMVTKILALNSIKANHSLASNPALSEERLQKFCQSDDITLLIELAKNETLHNECIEYLYNMGNEKIYLSLAMNPATNARILEKFSRMHEDIVKAVAANTNTPVDILYALHLDMRYNTQVKSNPSFGESIWAGIDGA